MNNIKVTIESIDAEGKGIAKIDGKIIFVDGALPQEEAVVEIYQSKSRFSRAKIIKLLHASPDRIPPPCPHIGSCGGCSLQHLNPAAQIASKQQVLISQLQHIGKVTAAEILPPVIGNPWEYRARARLSVHYNPSCNTVSLGFLRKSSSAVVDLQQCLILPKPLSILLPSLKLLIASLSIKETLSKIDLIAGEKVNVLMFHVMRDLTRQDQKLIADFIQRHSTADQPLQFWLQRPEPNKCYPLFTAATLALNYSLPNFKINMPYYPGEFTQINPEINQKMVDLAIELLNLNAKDTVLDCFCGIGNFTLPIATRAVVLGIDSDLQLINRARDNAASNRLQHQASYQQADLFKVNSQWLQRLGRKNKWLIDPPRSGAINLMQAICPSIAPDKIIYISCNPATLARDAAILTRQHGYQLQRAGIINMFPHTSHIESIAEFVRNQTQS